MNDALRQLFQAAWRSPANIVGPNGPQMPRQYGAVPMSDAEAAMMAAPGVSEAMAIAQGLQTPLPRSPQEWWDRMRGQLAGLADPTNVPMMLMGRIGPTPAAFSGALQGTKVLNKRGIPRMVFHGTPESYEGMPSLQHASPGLYGTGLYFTESPKIAGGPNQTSEYGYAIRTPGSMTIQQAIQRIDDIRTKQERAMMDYISDQQRRRDSLYPSGMGKEEAIQHWNKSLMGKSWENAITSLNDYIQSFGNPNVKPAYLSVKRPFDADNGFRDANRIVAEITGRTDRIHPGYRNNSGQRVSPYHAMVIELEDAAAAAGLSSMEFVNRALRDRGFDGITHIGGKFFKEQPHRVWVAFSEDQLVPAYGPKVGEGSFKRSTAKR